MSKCVAYTNHTLMPEALEQWPLDVMQELLPRHVEIILRIDKEFIGKVKRQYASWPKYELEQALDNMTIMGNYYRKSQSHSLLPDEGERSYVKPEDPKPKVRWPTSAWSVAMPSTELQSCTASSASTGSS